MVQAFSTYWQKSPRVIRGFFSIEPYKESRRLSFKWSILQAILGYLLLATISSVIVFLVVRFDRNTFETIDRIGLPTLENDRVVFLEVDPEVEYTYTDPFQLLHLSIIRGVLHRTVEDRTVPIEYDSSQLNTEEYQNLALVSTEGMQVVIPIVAGMWAFFAVLTIMIGRLMLLGLLSVVFGAFTPKKGSQKSGAEMFGLFSHASLTADSIVLLAILVYGGEVVSRIPLFSLVLFAVWGLVTYSMAIESRQGKIV